MLRGFSPALPLRSCVRSSKKTCLTSTTSTNLKNTSQSLIQHHPKSAYHSQRIHVVMGHDESKVDKLLLGCAKWQKTKKRLVEAAFVYTLIERQLIFRHGYPPSLVTHID